MFLAALQGSGGEQWGADAALMERLVRRQESALAELYDRYGRAVYSLAYRISKQDASAQEIVQEVFLQLWRNAHQYQPGRGALEPWLLTLARNRALDRVRSKHERQRQREDLMDEPSFDSCSHSLRLAGSHGSEGPELMIDQRTRARKVRDVVAALPEAQRRAVELAYFEGMTHSEIAEALKEPLGTVKTWIRSALARLRQELVEGT